MGHILRWQDRASYSYLGRWMATAFIAGTLGAATVRGVTSVVSLGLRGIAGLGVPAPLWATVAAFICGGLIYRLAPDAAGEGMPAYIDAIERRHARFPRAATLWKIPATIVTFLGFGCGGMVGPVGRTVAGLLALPFGGSIRPTRRASLRRTAVICGMSATIGAFFHSPIGAGIFAVEVVQRANMRYRDLFPSILAASISVGVSRALSWPAVISVGRIDGPWIPDRIPAVLALALVVAVASGLFVRGYALAVRLYRRDHRRTGPIAVVGMAVAVGVTTATIPSLLGSAPILAEIPAVGFPLQLAGRFSPSTPAVALVAIAIVVRALAAFATVGSGMSAGLTSPAFQVGLLLGVVGWRVAAPEASVLEALPFFAVGFSGMLAGAMNVPIAAAVMGIEVFGAGVGMPVAVSAIVAFQLNRHSTIYDFAVVGSGNPEDLSGTERSARRY